MPDRRRHRGPHPADESLFAATLLPTLRAAVADHSWLLTRNYAVESALKLVGDRYQLKARQRLAVRRSSCADQALEGRSRKLRSARDGGNLPLCIDGYNVLITVESALSKGLLFCGRDGCFRDLAGLHGTYRSVEETAPAIEIIGQTLCEQAWSPIVWYLDAPVSNSGRLAKLLREISVDRGWPWNVELVQNPDRDMAECSRPVATSDSWILDHCETWTPLARDVVEAKVNEPRIVWLNDPPAKT